MPLGCVTVCVVILFDCLGLGKQITTRGRSIACDLTDSVRPDTLQWVLKVNLKAIGLLFSHWDVYSIMLRAHNFCLVASGKRLTACPPIMIQIGSGFWWLLLDAYYCGFIRRRAPFSHWLKKLAVIRSVVLCTSSSQLTGSPWLFAKYQPKNVSSSLRTMLPQT